MQNKCQKHLFVPMKTPPPPVCPLKHVSICTFKNVPVCTGTTRTRFNTCARCAGTHGDVLNVHMGTCLSGHTGFFSVSHHTTTPHTPHRPHTTPRHKTQRRQTETDRDRDRGRRGDEREDDKTRAERREKSEEREDSFSVWWCMAVFLLV